MHDKGKKLSSESDVSRSRFNFKMYLKEMLKNLKMVFSILPEYKNSTLRTLHSSHLVED